MNACEFLFETLAIHDGSPYGREPVSQLDHALQCAALAVEERAPASLVVAALLHDIGHLIPGAGRDFGARPANYREDDRHEIVGAAMLDRWFGPVVTQPIRLHVPAKRYLCAVDPDYYDGLSAGSRKTLELQGEAFDEDAAKRFLAQPYAEDAVRLRRWDDRAKTPNLDVPRLDRYREDVEQALLGAKQAEPIAI